MKKIIGVLFTLLTISAAWAADKNIALYVGHANGGIAAAHATAVSVALEQRGWRIDLKIIGNCGQVKHLAETSDKPILISWGSEWNNPGNTCNFPVTKQNFVDILQDSPRLICGPPGRPNFQFEKGHTYRIGINAGQYHDILLKELGEKIGVQFKTIEYRNSGFIVKGMQAKEIDLWYANKGLVEHSARTQKCLYGTMQDDHDGIIALRKIIPTNQAYAASVSYLFTNDKFSKEQRQLLITDVEEIIKSKSYQDILNQGGNFTVKGTAEEKIKVIERNSRSYLKPNQEKQ